MTYNHTQIGRLMIFTLLAVIFHLGFVLFKTGFMLNLVVMGFFTVFIVASFTTLQVKINQKYLKIKFGYGIFSKRFTLAEIASAKVVKNNWWFGWGIRIWFWPKMMIYNVSGYDAVEIKMKNGKRYRIGTDEPQKLESALKRAI
jgi:hypothetical protein